MCILFFTQNPNYSPLERCAEPAEVGWLTEGETGWIRTLSYHYPENIIAKIIYLIYIFYVVWLCASFVSTPPSLRSRTPQEGKFYSLINLRL